MFTVSGNTWQEKILSGRDATPAGIGCTFKRIVVIAAAQIHDKD